MHQKQEKQIKQLIIFTAILSIFIAFIGLHAATVRGVDKKLSIFSAFGEGIDHLSQKPFDITINEYTSQTIITYVFGFIIVAASLIIEMERNIHDDSKTINGSAEWLNNLAEYNKKYTDPPKSVNHNGYKNMILSNDLFLSMNGRQTMKNNNILVVGGAGTGKSRFIVKPNVLQMNASFVITDPSGELLESCGKVLEDNGYTIKVFNLTNMRKSNHYNPLHYIRDDLGVFMLVDCLITNTTPADQGKGDAFWVKSETALLEAIIFYLVRYKPKEFQNFSTVMEYLRKGTIKEGADAGVNDLDKTFEELRSKHPDDIALKQYDAFKSGSTKTLQSIIISCQMRLASFNIKEIADLTNTDDIELSEVADKKHAVFIILPTAHATFNYLASLMYSQLFETLYYHAEMECPNSYIVKTKSGEPIKFFKGLTKEQKDINLEVAQSKECTMADEIERIKNSDDAQQAKEKGQKYIDEVLKNIKYEVTKEDPNRYKILTQDGELITYFNCNIQKKSKREKYIKEKLDNYRLATVQRVGLHLPIDIRFLLDEFANIGQIPDFVQKLSTMRKYLMSCTIILQSLSQIKTMYKDNWENIVSNCHFIYLGGNEETTLKYINEMLGKATVIKRGRSSSHGKGSGSLSYNLDGRELMTINEIASMPGDECIVMLTGMKPYKGKKFTYENHPNYQFTADCKEDNIYMIDLNKLIPNKEENEKIMKENINREKEKEKEKEIEIKKKEEEKAKAKITEKAKNILFSSSYSAGEMNKEAEDKAEKCHKKDISEREKYQREKNKANAEQIENISDNPEKIIKYLPPDNDIINNNVPIESKYDDDLFDDDTIDFGENNEWIEMYNSQLYDFSKKIK